MARKPFMAGNWKMNLDHLEAIAHVQKIAFGLNDDDFAAVEVGVMVPFTDIRSVQTLVDADDLKVVYGSQDISAHDKGAYTGEISGSMLSKLGCTYAVIGHSERRQYHGEDDAIVNAKVKAAYSHGLTPIMCIGEVKEEREAGIQEQVTLGQLDGGLADIPADQAATIVIAYEPVWAIGTGLTATPQDAQDMCGAIRGRLGRALRLRGRRGHPDPVRRFREVCQCGRDHGRPGRRRGPHRWRVAGRRRVRGHLQVPPRLR